MIPVNVLEMAEILVNTLEKEAGLEIQSVNSVTDADLGLVSRIDGLGVP